MGGEKEPANGGQRHSPLVSVITVVRNAKQELADVLESVWAFRDQDLEIVVMDGGSSDGTAEYLEDHRHVIDYWASEPDRGIYDAMNKAIEKASGTFLLHLNAGDRLLRVPTEELRAAEAEGVDVAAFGVLVDGRRVFRPSCGPGLRFNNTLHHQGTYFRRSTFPAYDLRYRIFADFDANQKLALRGARMKMFPGVTSFHATAGVSDRNSPKAAAEFFSVVTGNHGRKALPVTWMLAKWRGLSRRVWRD